MTYLINILIGIVSGVFSSVIISVIFFEITKEQNDKNDAKNMVYPLYGILLFSSNIITSANSNGIDIQKGLKNAFEELSDNFSKYEPWKYKGRLKIVMDEVSEFVTKGYQYVGIKDTDLKEIKTTSQKLINSLQDYERYFGKYCFKNIMQNFTIKVCGIILILLVITILVLFSC